MTRTFACLLSVLLSVPLAAQSRPGFECDPGNAGLRLPDGFCALVFAEGLGPARHMAVAPNGDVFVAVASGRGSQGAVIALRDADGDGRADVRERFGPTGGNGIWLRGETLFFSPNDAVLRFRIPAGSLTPAGAPDTLVLGLPTGGHTAKSVVVTEDGSLFVNIGSRGNVCPVARDQGSRGQDPCVELETRAGIWRFDADRLRQRQDDGARYATGLRNTNALTLGPDGVLYGAVHGRDQLFQGWGDLYDAEAGAELPSEKLVRIREGDDFGWPYCYHDRFLGRLVLAPEYGGDAKAAGRCTAKTEPLVGFPGHWAPNGLAFYTGSLFPRPFRGGLFIAFHGSWNRSPLPQAGYNVAFQPMSGGRPSGEWSVFADGFRSLDPPGRPVGVAIGPDGSLFVSDDAGGRIFRIVPR